MAKQLCITCGYELVRIGVLAQASETRVWSCYRCGTVKLVDDEGAEDLVVPHLVIHAREVCDMDTSMLNSQDEIRRLREDCTGDKERTI